MTTTTQASRQQQQQQHKWQQETRRIGVATTMDELMKTRAQRTGENGNKMMNQWDGSRCGSASLSLFFFPLNWRAIFIFGFCRRQEKRYCTRYALG